MEYSNLVDKFDEMGGGADDDYDALCRWIVKPCFPYFRECTVTLPENLTFEAFYYPAGLRTTINPECFAWKLPWCSKFHASSQISDSIESPVDCNLFIMDPFRNSRNTSLFG